MRGRVVAAQCLADTARHFVVLAAVHGSLGLPGWRLFRGFTLLSHFSHSSPSLIGLLASVDVKQHVLSHALNVPGSSRGRSSKKVLL